MVTYTYDTWGKLTSIGGNKSLGEKNPYRYRGYRYDNEMGLYYLQARYYNPEMGRFINADGLISTGQGFIGNNMFAYWLNDPVNIEDPSGEFAWFLPLIIGAVGVIAIGAVVAVSILATVIVADVSHRAMQDVQKKVVSSVITNTLKAASKNKGNNKKSDKKPDKSNNKNNLNPQQLNQYKSKVLEGKDIHLKSKEQAVDFVKNKFPEFQQEVAQGRSSQGWHFDSHPIRGSANPIEHINIYSKSGGFRVHITWD